MRSGTVCARIAAAAAFVALASGALAGSARVPARLAQARYVALGYDVGDGFLSETAALKSAVNRGAKQP